MKHKQKLRLARKLLSNYERRRGVSPFQSSNWEARRNGIAQRVHEKEFRAQVKAKRRHLARITR